ncbi:AAA family ATPase [Flavobacterium quisquiliarum]|uniref:AAA family ATPase n=1 Tax=Flavobacterium quisquiliarum TaxID=1834436 RepID=A0ABV8W1J1_9FLAO|nr:AAA family ATPase [Flavobacterium quisquiliarum]MBW1655914.1 AAA family ATPase [Flavobacterium quisquiliarum]
MEIVYLFIKDFNSLKNQNINFGSEYKFEFSPQTNTLTAFRNELFIADFYNINSEGAKVVNLSTIIGKNGTGKSSILEFMTTNFTTGINLQDECIVVYKNNSEFKAISTQEIKYVNDVITQAEVIEKKYLDDPKLRKMVDLGFDFDGFDNTDFIYFSNIFDGSPSYQRNGLHNISTNFLIFQDHNAAILQKTILPGNQNPVGVHLVDDVFRQVKFITDDVSKNRVNFKLPETLDINFNLEYLLSDSQFENNFEIQKTFILLKGNLLEGFDYNITGSAVINRFILFTILNLIKEILSIAVSLDRYKNGFELKFTKDFHSTPEGIPYKNLFFHDAVTYFLDAVQNSLSKNRLNVEHAKSMVYHTRELIELILQNEPEFIQSIVNPVTDPTLSIKVQNKELLTKFIQTYLKTFSVNPYLKFVWRKLSSGEKALLNIYSRFFSLTDLYKTGEKLAKNLIILIDEGDVYLHPSWQKKFVKNILEYLPIILKADGVTERNLQIIFTTNSPIPASDVLNYNTIFLDKILIEENDTYDYRVVVKDSLNDQKENFAANINTLLSDSFFVTNGLIGEFAAAKINAVISTLSSRKKISAEEREKTRLLIHQIGEPIIKNKLMQIYNDRYNLEIHERLDRIERKLGE